MTNNSLPANYYNDDYGDEACNQTEVFKFGAISTSVFFSIVFVLSLVGNFLVLAILLRYENIRSVTNTLILNLAVSDLLFTASLPFWIYYDLHGWTLGQPTCKLVNWVFYTGFCSSSILLVLMTVHRYIAVMNPLSNIVSAAGFPSIVVTVVVWVVSILIASPSFIFSEVTKHEDSLLCFYPERVGKFWVFYQQNVFFVVSSIVFIFCYSKILSRLMGNKVQRRKNRTLKLIFILVVVFFIEWTPYNYVIFQMSRDVLTENDGHDCGSFTRQMYAYYISRMLAFSHCCLNPVFYVLLGVKFKNHLKKMLQRCTSDSHSIPTRPSRNTIMSVTSEELSM
ncbi:Chemokine XC receptor 1 [Oryzias melastigma]|uniref:Chemokine (C motif) receptor 1b, duplicate 1 n=1 Tax=Oryzias melastigma TaxID=30732 RepID=A0A3B3BUZ5_ORYME|nr:chemokine XC receptor 1 [Oryzias melastigma]KAF6733999.1 Chemokine XC receptor 1 [Oryzias melastigma]